MSRIKICVMCKLSQSIKEFTKNKSKPDGLNNYCRVCQKIYREKHQIKNKNYQKQYRQTNKSKLQSQAQTYRKKNKQKIKSRDQVYYQKHKTELLKYNKEWRQRNQEHIKIYKRNQYVLKHKQDIEYRILANLRSRIRIAMKNGKKCEKTTKLLGCSIKFFREYLENKFDNRMSWDNYGVHGWHIDHIKPCAAFNLINPEEQKRCFHYTNLQPLWAIENLIKSNKQ